MATKSNTPPPADSASASQSFESALKELEGIVAAMEAGQMPLQDALDAYRRGTVLLRQCQDTLTAAERQISILDANALRDFDAAGNAPAGDSGSGGGQSG